MGLVYRQKGIVLVSSLFLMIVLLGLLAAFFTVTNIEMATTKYSKKSATGFYAAEAGLNIRAEQIRQIFVGFNRPAGTSPTTPSACTGSNLGSADYVCQNFAFGRQTARTYITEEPGNPIITTIPPGQLYQGLNAQEYRYTAVSEALDPQGRVEAKLELRFRSRLVPLFQFVAFYDKDLEILPGPIMNLSGPVHTNRDLYLNSDATLNINGQVSSAGTLYRGRKNTTVCNANSVTVRDPATARQLQPTCPSRTVITTSALPPFNGMIRTGVSSVTVPDPGEIDPTASGVYWRNADLRMVLRLNAGETPNTVNSVTGIEIRNSDNSVNATLTNNLHSAGCTGSISGRPIGSTATFYNNREAKFIRMLEVDMQALFNCAHATNILNGRTLNDSTDGGLVIYLGVEGPNSNAVANKYGVRVRNGATLQASTVGAATVRGLTMVSNQAFYVQGNYNSGVWIPSAIMADSLNILSGALVDANTPAASFSSRVPTNTSVYAAFLAGTDTTGDIEGTGGQGGAYNGGLENYPRFHENWSARTVTYRGSFVSLGRPRHVNGNWIYGSPYYNAPNRDWDYDTRFNNAANLPPLTPRFVYLRQELFVRDFEQ